MYFSVLAPHKQLAVDNSSGGRSLWMTAVVVESGHLLLYVSKTYSLLLLKLTSAGTEYT